MPKKVLIWLISICQISYTIAQSNINGRVVNEEGMGIANANVFLKTKEKIIAFASTGGDGHFILKYAENLRNANATIEINHVSYVRLQIPFRLESDLTVTLHPKQNLLEAVQIGKPPIMRQNRDTIIYQVQNFADSSDRSIGEVLRKMPGFHVDDNGAISYNGQTISKFYIDGDDLLGNRYGIGAKTIPHDLVTTVEVYKNHQEIRALKDKLNSNDVAINLSIKETAKAKLLGEVKAGGGIPGQYHVHLSNIYLNKGFKMLNDVKTTSLEEDVELAVRDLVIRSKENQSLPILKTGMTDVPNEPTGNFNRNNSTGISSNLLFKTKGNWNLKVNGGAYLDRKIMNTFALQKYVLIDDEVTNTESTDITFKPLQTDFSANLTKNTEALYLSNELFASLKNHRTSDQLSSNSFTIQEQLQQRSFSLRNSTQFIPNTKNKNVWNFRWLNSFSDSPEIQHYLSDSTLNVLEIFGLFEQARQAVRKQEFSSSLLADFTGSRWRNLYHTYGVEGGLNVSKLNSNLRSVDAAEGSLEILNNSHWNEIKGNFHTQLQWNRKAIRFNVRVPVGIQHIYVRDDTEKKADTRSYLLFTPAANLRYIISRKQHLKLEFSREQLFGRIDDIYSNVIMSDFRTLSRGIPVIPYTLKHDYQLGYGLDFVEKMLFLNIHYSYSTARLNLTHKLEIEENNTRSLFIEEDNKLETRDLKLSASKFLGFLNGTSSIQISHRTNHSERIINDEMLPFKVNNMSLSPILQGKLGTFLHWNYTGSLNWMKGQTAEVLSADEKTQIQRHAGQVTFHIRNNIFWSIQGNTFRLKNDVSKVNLNFLNASIRVVSKRPVSMVHIPHHTTPLFHSKVHQ